MPPRYTSFPASWATTRRQSAYSMAGAVSMAGEYVRRHPKEAMVVVEIKGVVQSNGMFDTATQASDALDRINNGEKPVCEGNKVEPSNPHELGTAARDLWESIRRQGAAVSDYKGRLKSVKTDLEGVENKMADLQKAYKAVTGKKATF